MCQWLFQTERICNALLAKISREATRLRKSSSQEQMTEGSMFYFINIILHTLKGTLKELAFPCFVQPAPSLSGLSAQGYLFIHIIYLVGCKHCSRKNKRMHQHELRNSYWYLEII